jgi:RND superfamily putative drug exporter
MGILTWIFVDGHFASWLNFTPTPLMVVIIALVVAVGYGLATDYEVFLVSRMVEARERGMSTAEAIRIGTATTGRLITAAACVLAVVAASFVFSDLVMMKYLAFGLMAALLLDATVVRMFLVPAVMKLLGDDCWWAPRWARRLQNRMGLGEIDLPDERKRSVLDGRPTRPPVGAGLVAATPRPPHDPTHPAALEPARPGPAAEPEVRPAQELPAPAASAASTARIPAGQPTKAKTTRRRQPTNANPAPVAQTGPARAPRAPATRAAPPPAPTPSSGQTRAMPIPTDRSGDDTGDQADPTAALPVMPSDADDSEAATEQLNTRGQSDKNGDRRRRGGGGLSAQDLLRREGRL